MDFIVDVIKSTDKSFFQQFWLGGLPVSCVSLFLSDINSTICKGVSGSLSQD